MPLQISRTATETAALLRSKSISAVEVAQEALANAVKHSQSARLEATLNADLEFVYLEVRDFGCGFDVTTVRRRSGLGLASMEERVHLVGGELTIASELRKGASIRACIPLPVSNTEDDET